MKQGKAALALAVAALFAVGIVSVPAGETSADPAEDSWIGTGNYDTTWYSSTDTSFKISTAAQLAGMAYLVNNGTSFDGCTVTLTADIDVSAHTWTPIGTSSNPFEGVFDGDGHTISGITIDIEGQGTNDLYLGLFGAVSGTANSKFAAVSDAYSDYNLNYSVIAEDNYTAVLKNVVISNFNIGESGGTIGALAGSVTDTLVWNVTVNNGAVVALQNSGGVVGRSYGSVLAYCTTGEDVDVSTLTYTGENVYNFGGIVGTLRESSSGNPSAVINCTNNADVSVYLFSGGAGGITGHVGAGHSVLIYGCYNDGTVTVAGTAGSSNSYNSVAGGIGGQCWSATDSVIAVCINHGTVTTSENVTAGALSGVCNYYNGLVYDSSNEGTISGSAHVAAGIVSMGATVTVDSCQNAGNITAAVSKSSSTICAGTGTVTMRNMNFADAADLLSAMPIANWASSSTDGGGATVILEGIVLNSDSTALSLPAKVVSLSSDTNLMDVEIGTDSSEANIGIPGATVTVKENVTAKSLTLSADDMTADVYGTATSLSVTGGNAVVHNYGTIGTLLANELGDTVFSLRNGSDDGDNSSVTLTTFRVSASRSTTTNYGSIGTVYLYDGDATIVNHGTITQVDDFYFKQSEVYANRTGAGHLTLYNGQSTTERTSAVMNRISATYVSVTMYNYGTLTSNGYLISIGTEHNGTDAAKNTFVLHNYGEMIGTRTASEIPYMIFAPCAASVEFYFHTGSSFDNQCTASSTDKRWCIFYGMYGSRDRGTAAEKYDDASTFLLRYAEDTVKSNGTAITDFGTGYFVGTDDKDAKFDFSTDFGNADTYDVTFIFNDGNGVTLAVAVGTSGTVTLTDADIPVSLAFGMSVTGWTYKDGSAWDGTVSGDTEVYAVWTLDKPAVVLSGQNSGILEDQLKLSADITNLNVSATYSYTWYRNGTEMEGETDSALDVTAAGTYRVVVTAVCDEQTTTGYAEIGITYAETYTVTITLIAGDNSDITTESVPGGSAISVSGSYLLISYGHKYTYSTEGNDSSESDDSLSGYVFGGWYYDSAHSIPVDTSSMLSSDVTLYGVWFAESSGEIVVESEGTSSSMSAGISSEAVASASDNGSSIVISGSDGTSIELDSQTAAGLVGGSLLVSVENVTDSHNYTSLTGSSDTYELTITRNGEEVTSFAGTVTVSIPFTLPAGCSVQVYHVNTADYLEPIDSTYSNGMLTFSTSHFSLYSFVVSGQTILPDDNRVTPSVVTEDSSDDDAVKVAACAAAAVAAALMAAFILMDIRRK